MTRDTSTTTPNPSERLGAPSARGLWALGFVVLSLVALVAAPAYFGRRVDVVQSRITEVLEPAARLSSALRLLKARQFARMEGFLATEDRAFRDPYNAAIDEEDAVLENLGELAAELGLDVRDQVARVSSASFDWRFLNQRIFELQLRGEGIDPDARDQVVARYEELQRVTEDLDRTILAEVAAGRREVDRERRRQSQVTWALAIVALVASLIVGRVAFRYRDLTVERERRRREAVRARREIDALLEATGDGVLGVDLDGKCISLNRAGSKLLGYTEGEILGRDLHDTLMHTLPGGEASHRDASHVVAAVERGEPLESEDGSVMWRRRGIPFPARWSLRPMIDGTELRGAVLTFTDMTEIQEKEEALRRAIRQREDVVSIVSHDLRNPLGVALAAADLLLELPLDEGQRRRQAEIIRRSGKRMQRLIEDLLDVSRIEAGVLVVRPSREELLPILNEVVELFGDQAASRSLRLGVEPTAEKAEARVDRDRIIQALANLLDNAVRLTPEGGSVTVSTRVEDRGPTDDGWVLISVADTGPGIEPDEVERLFDRFEQGEGRDTGAAGLGLTIVQGVAVAHGGEVLVDSTPGEGTVFTLRLPRSGPPMGEG
jgi:PAS domain S-box-containing protein